jgi:hypothetical protein
MALFQISSGNGPTGRSLGRNGGAFLMVSTIRAIGRFVDVNRWWLKVADFQREGVLCPLG